MGTGKIKTLLCDIGGVILTNGWDRKSREKASREFSLNLDEFNSRHALIFGNYEVGKINLDEYLKYTVFYEPRDFSVESFKEFVFDQSQPYPEMLDFLRQTKKENGFKVIFFSNEGRELTEYRIKTFKLNEIADFFVVSCFVGISKPDKKFYQMAIDMSQTPLAEIAYIDDRPLFVELGNDLGLHGIRHQELKQTKAALEALL